jgi:hypothetical protein
VVICAARPILDRLMPEPRSAADEVGRFATRLATGGNAHAGVLTGAARIGVVVVAVLGVGVGIVAAGTPARGVISPDIAEVLGTVPHEVDPSTFPTIDVDQEVADWDHQIAGPGMQDVVQTLAENLELENQALLRRDPAILTAVDHGDRLIAMQARLDEAIASGTTPIAHYDIESIDVTLLAPFGKQTGLSLGFESRGTVTEETYDAAGNLVSRETSPFEQIFVMRRATGGRWLNVDTLPAQPAG